MTSSRPSLSILVLGGTRFLGRSIVEQAVASGHTLTLFNRGITDPALFPNLKTIRGDRNQPEDLAQLRGGDFDVVIDVAAYTPLTVRRSAEALAGRIGRYVFISTRSVYADNTTPQDETGKTVQLEEGLAEGEGSYAARKAACEGAVLEVFGDQALIPRLGMIFGPHDRSDRFAYWPRRLASGGRVLVPGSPTDLAQFIDVRDAAAWIVTAASADLTGVYNVVGRPIPVQDFITACGTDATATIEWAPPSRLRTLDIDPSTEAPMWTAIPGTEGTAPVDVTKAFADGLATRPLVDTVADTRSWDTARGGPQPGREALAAARERDLLLQLVGRDAGSDGTTVSSAGSQSRPSPDLKTDRE